jgi:hypothetical protein
MNALTLKKENLHIVSTANTTSSTAYTYGYQPIATGESVPNFYLPTQHAVTKQLLGSLSREAFISLQDLLDDQQSLVIAFIGAPGQAAINIQQLEKLHAAIQAEEGKLIVFTAIKPKYLRRQFKQSNTLHIFYDEDNTIAELFGLYDIQNPLWQWASGIEEEEESLPALYVISPDSKVAFNYVDYSFNLFTGNSYPLQSVSRALFDVMNELSLQNRYQPDAYKLVS